MIAFVNIENQRQFEQDGYTVIDLLDANQVEKLRSLYFSTKIAHAVVQEKMHSTSDTHNVDLILQMNEDIQRVVSPVLPKQLKSFDMLIAGFLVKEPGEGSETGFHQDPTLVDSMDFVSANIWIPLQDTNHENGNLRLVKGSHRLADMLVVTPQFPTVHDLFNEKLIEYATEVPVKAGQAIILNNKLIHGASTNQTDEERIAIVMAIKSQAASWSFHYMDPMAEVKQIEQFRIDTLSFASMKKNQRPEHAEFIGYIDFDFPQLSYADFKTFMDKNYGANSLFSRIKRKLAAWIE